MLIIFEGPNRAGKTTLLRCVRAELERRRPWRPKVCPQGPYAGTSAAAFPHGPVTHSIYNTLTLTDYAERDVLVDRLWITDFVYEQIHTREPYDRSYVNPLRDFKFACCVYVTVDDPQTLLTRGGYDAMSPEAQTFPKIHELFDDYFGKFSRYRRSDWLPWTTVNTSHGDPNVKDVVDKILLIDAYLRESENL